MDGACLSPDSGNQLQMTGIKYNYYSRLISTNTGLLLLFL